MTTLNKRTRKEEKVPINTIACSRYRTIDIYMKKDLVKILEGKSREKTVKSREKSTIFA